MNWQLGLHGLKRKIAFTWQWGLPACYKRKQGEKQRIFNAFLVWCSSKCCLIGGLLKSLSLYTVLYLPQIQLNLFLRKVVLLFHVTPVEKESKFLNSWPSVGYGPCSNSQKASGWPQKAAGILSCFRQILYAFFFLEPRTDEWTTNVNSD